MIRVALVDDQALFRAGIRMLVDSQPDLEVVAEAGPGDLVVCLGAGNITSWANALPDELQALQAKGAA